MISFLSFVYLLYGLSAVQSETSPPKYTGVGILSNKPIMCAFRGNLDLAGEGLSKLDPKDIPVECDVIIYCRFSINLKSKLNFDTELLQQVATKRPIILLLNHQDGYSHWVSLLKHKKQYEETKIIREFALANKINGILLADTYPADETEKFNKDVGPNLQYYIKQLKGNSNLVIGLAIPSYPNLIKSKCMFKYEELNAMVDFYNVETYALNACKPEIFNGIVPIGKTEYGPKYYLGMEEVAQILSETQIDKKKLVYEIQMTPTYKESVVETSYHHVCTNQYNSSWCIENTMNFYLKGSFVREQNALCNIKYIEFDDIKNECGCGNFIGLRNVAAGYRNGKVTRCTKFDVKKSCLI